MKKQVIYFIGIDVSKHTLDVALISLIKGVKQSLVSFVVNNTVSGLKELKTTLKKHSVAIGEKSLG